MMRPSVGWLFLLLCGGFPAFAGDGGELSRAQQTAVADVAGRVELIKAVNRKIWDYAEVGLEETRSSALLQKHLKENGFKVKNGVAGMPTAFVASYGSGKPVIGILAEYDALPGMSQKVEPVRAAVRSGQPGHACGHSGLGSGALGAALAVKAAMDRHKIKGTIRLYGTPAEETVIGKVYMLLDGQFDDLDICLHWHPSSRNGAWAGTSKALVSVKFSFDGTAAHASGSPESGRSALDAVELMNVGVNYMREHVKEDARMHYVITNGGGAPNVVPPVASVWYYIRADDHRDVEANFKWIQDIARGAALMTRTKMRMQVDTDCHELITNVPLAELLEEKLKTIGPPKFNQVEKAFARRLQQPLIEQFGDEFPKAIDESIRPYAESMAARTRGSTDVGDISWYVPTGGISTSCLAAKSPGHSWQNVAAIGSTIGEKGIVYASKVLAATAIELFEDPARVAAAKADWTKRMEKRKYTTLIPKGQPAPVRIR
ncbi:MAG: amidohydrolase [Planctomycetaceae bacterium]|nr:amidohydrolase [Planctomycetaceae bacterium]